MYYITFAFLEWTVNCKCKIKTRWLNEEKLFFCVFFFQSVVWFGWVEESDSRGKISRVWPTLFIPCCMFLKVKFYIQASDIMVDIIYIYYTIYSQLSEAYLIKHRWVIANLHPIDSLREDWPKSLSKFHVKADKFCKYIFDFEHNICEYIFT